MKIGCWQLAIIISACLVCQVVSADDAELATQVSVATGKISQTTLRRYVLAYGVVEPEIKGHAASAKIAAPSAGIIAQSQCEEGQTVKKGALLFELDSRAVDALLTKAQVAVQFADKNFVRKQSLNASENISRKLYEDAEQALQAARADLRNIQMQRELLRITAPLAGTVTVCHFKVGEAVTPSVPLVEIIDLQRLNISIRVPSMEAIAVRLTQPVDINASDIVSNNDTSEHGQVTFIGSQVDPLTDTLLVRASLPSDSLLRAGQLVSVRIRVEERVNRLAVPIDSVVIKDDTAYIGLVNGDRAKQQVVKVGLRDGDLIEIQADGLQEGMTIVTKGVYSLPAETQIRVLP